MSTDTITNQRQRQLGLSACWDLIRSTPVGRLAVVVQNRPDILPVNHLVDHGTVVFRTGAGTKLLAATRTESVAFEVDGWDHVTGEAWSVVVKGRAELIKRMDELIASAGWPLYPWHEGPKPTFVRIVPGEVTGRRFRAADRSAWASPFPSGPRQASE